MLLFKVERTSTPMARVSIIRASGFGFRNPCSLSSFSVLQLTSPSPFLSVKKPFLVVTKLVIAILKGY